MNDWIDTITTNCKAAGTYRPEFDSLIAALADLYERKTIVEQQYKDEGSQILVEYTNKNGSTNLIKNPLLQMIIDLDRDILAFSRELGLTPRSNVRLRGRQNNKEHASLTDVLNSIENGGQNK